MKKIKLFLSFIVTILMIVSSMPTPVQAQRYNADDFSKLKWKIANNTTLQNQLATVADSLGFAWVLGTESQYVGENFDVWQDYEGNIHLKGHYDENDPYADGYRADERTEIVLSNFRYNIDPDKIQYGEPEISKIDNVVRGEVSMVNLDSKDATMEQWLNYSHAYSKSHTTNTKITVGTKISDSVKVSSAPFGLGAESTYQFEFNFSAENGWQDQTTTTETVNETQKVSVPVPALSQKKIIALATEATSKLPYNVEAELLYDISFTGFLRYTGNARSDHPTNRPTVTISFGNDGMGGWEDIKDKYEHRDISGYTTLDNYQWDWNWAATNGNPNLDYVMNSDTSSTAIIDGVFTAAKDIETKFVATKSISVDDSFDLSDINFSLLEVLDFGNEITVATDGSGDYTTIAAAIDALPDTGGTIDIMPGEYNEKLSIAKKNVTLLGMGSDASQVTITNNDYSPKTNPDTGQPYGTSGSATVTVTGSNFYASNLTIQNTADFEAPNYEANNQAVALLSKGDRAVYRAVRVLGGQDTLYVTNAKRAYFNNCYVEGYVDYIFGNGKAVFDNCKIKSKVHTDLRGEVTITAQSRKSSSEDSGYVFNNATLLFDDIYMDNVWLGRPWKAYSTVYFLNTKMAPQVKSLGWIEFVPEEYAPGQGTNYLPTSTYREYNSIDADISQRESISPNSNVELSSDEAAALAADTYLAGDDSWQPTQVSYGMYTKQDVPVPTLPIGAPGAPTIYSVTAGNQNLQVSWGGKPANPQTSGYQIWAVQNGVTSEVVEVPPTATSGFVGGLTNGVPAQIYVAGVNAKGVGKASVSSSVTPVSDAPSVPSDISFLSDGNGNITMNFNIADEGSQPVYGGTIEHAGVYTALYASKNDAYAGNAIEGTSHGFTTMSYTFNNIKPNTTYWVALWAYNGQRSPILITSFTDDGTLASTPANNSNYIKMKNRTSGLYLDGMGRTSNGSDCGQWSSSINYNQQWLIVSYDNYVRIKNRASGLYLDGMGRTSDGSICGQWSLNSSNNQLWIKETVGNYVKFKNVATNLYLDGLGTNTNGSNACQWSGSSNYNQQWSIIQ